MKRKGNTNNTEFEGSKTRLLTSTTDLIKNSVCCRNIVIYQHHVTFNRGSCGRK